MNRLRRLIVVAASVLLIAAARPQPVAATETGVCEAACWSAWVLCIFTTFPYCNPMLDGCLAGCEYPR